MNWFDLFIQQTLNGLTRGSIFALIALGYTMVYGIIELINFAHGDIFMLGLMVSLTLLVDLGLTQTLHGWELAAVLPLIIVGTMTVFVTRCCSTNVNTCAGSNNARNTDPPPSAGTPSIPPIDAAWNIGVWCKNTSCSLNRHVPSTWYRFNISAR